MISFLINAAMAVLYFSFANSHLTLYFQTYDWVLLLPTAQETLLCTLFLIRRQTVRVSPYVMDWVVGVAGSFLPLLVRANVALSSFDVPGRILQIIGFAVSLIALVSLNRSIGIVAADRGVKTGGLYRVVRHPMYLGYMLSLSGYWLLFPSTRNFVIVYMTIILLIARIELEEYVLTKNPKYREYCEVVGWRIVPGIY